MKKRCYKRGGSKNEVLSKKIAKLVQEGYGAEEAATIAQYMYKNGGQLPEYQVAGTKQPTSEEMRAKGYTMMNGRWVLNNIEEFKNPSKVVKPSPPDPNSPNKGTTVPLPPTTQINPVVNTPSIFPTTSWAPTVGYNGMPRVYNSATGQYEESKTAYMPSAGNTPFVAAPTATPIPQQPITQPTIVPQTTMEEDFAQMDADRAVKDLDWLKKNAPQTSLGDTSEMKDPNLFAEFDPYYEEPVQMFNPYAGFDIPTAAYTLGQGIETGNAFDIATSGVKLATGLGRNVMGGVGQARKTAEAQKEFQMKARQASMPKYEYLQEGGEMPQQDIMQVVQAYAQATGQDPNQILEQLKQLPEEELAVALESMMAEMQQPEMKEGGDFKKELTGEYTSEKEFFKKGQEPVAELEDGEYLQKPDGNITKITGDKHTNGGVELTEEQIPDGSKVISDHLKLGAENAKMLKQKFDVDVKASDTYASVLEKWSKKSGIKKIAEEQEDVIAKLEKQSETIIEDPQLNTTTNLNVMFLQKKLGELEKQKAPLEKARQSVFDEVYSMQEANKKVSNDSSEMQMGGQYNGDMVIGYSKKYNLPEDKVRGILEEYRNGGLAKYQDAGLKIGISNVGENINNSGMSDAQFFQQKAQERAVTGVAGKARTYTPEEKEAIKKHYSKFILDKASLESLKKSIDSDELVFNEGMLQTIGTGQALPIELQHKDNPSGTYGNQDEARINGYLYNETFKQKTGRNFNPNNPEDTKLIYDVVIPALKEKGIDYKGAPFRGQKEDAYGNIVASEPGFIETTQAKKVGSIDLDKFRTATSGQKQLIADEYGVPVAELEKSAVNPANKFLKLTPQGIVAAPTADPTVSTAEQISAYTGDVNLETGVDTNVNGARKGVLLLPDQTPLMPGSMRPALKAERTYERIDAPRMSPDALIQEIRRQEQSAMEGISQLPDAQRAAATAQIQANTQAELNKVMSQTESQNMLAKTQTDQFNAQTQRVEEDYRVKDLQDYETKILTADWKTEANLRSYYNQLQKINNVNYNAVENVNLLNQAFENVAYTPNGIQATNLAPIADYKTATAPQTEKKPKKRAGGRFKK